MSPAIPEVLLHKVSDSVRRGTTALHLPTPSMCQAFRHRMHTHCISNTSDLFHAQIFNRSHNGDSSAGMIADAARNEKKAQHCMGYSCIDVHYGTVECLRKYRTARPLHRLTGAQSGCSQSTWLLWSGYPTISHADMGSLRDRATASHDVLQLRKPPMTCFTRSQQVFGFARKLKSSNQIFPACHAVARQAQQTNGN